VFLPKFLTKFFTKKKLALLLVVCCLLSVLVARPIFAFSTPTARGGYLWTFENAVFQTDEMNLQSFVNESFKATAAAVWTSIVGCISCDETTRERYPGLLLAMGGLMTEIYTHPPASTTKYLAHLGNKLGIVQPVYAQGESGIGFQAMEFLIPIWEAFRNLAYGLSVIIFVIIGFAIMFRMKISPQAVITIESALPKIIIALLLITFSYAIVGFMIDIMYVLIFLINGIFRSILISRMGWVGTTVNEILDGLIELAEGSDFLGPGAPLVIKTIFTNFVFFNIVPFLAFIILVILGPIGWLFGLFIAILILIAFLRCIWTLLKAYAMVIINLIFAPVIILMGAIPGSNAIGSWFKSVIANLAVLPVMTTMFFLASYLVLEGILGIITDPLPLLVFAVALIPGLGTILGLLGAPILFHQIFMPSPHFWHLFGTFVLPIVGLVILLMAPRAADMIQSIISGQPFAYGTAIGQAITAPGVIAGTVIGYTAQGIKAAGDIATGWRKIREKAPPPTPRGEIPSSRYGPSE
jgi:hypothetical protein